MKDILYIGYAYLYQLCIHDSLQVGYARGEEGAGGAPLIRAVSCESENTG